MSENHSVENTMVVNAAGGKDCIHKEIYGHFSEHLGRCIYDGFWTGKDTNIPHTRGIRNDIVTALRNINIPVLRWPGGCFADEYHWQDGIGPYESRPSMVNTHWGGMTENNHFGTHEFLDLCEQLGCEPYISGNVGSGTVQEMQQWIEYITFDGQSPIADLRREHGRQNPWSIKYWGVGNESWGCGGNMRPEFYADIYRQFSAYCRDFGQNRLYKIACGSHDADYAWTEVLMREACQFFNGLSLHYYTIPGTWQEKGAATQFDEAEWFTTLKKALVMDELIDKHSTIMDRYDPERRVGMIVDEWGTWFDAEPGTNPKFLYQQNSLRDALVAGVTLNIFHTHCQRVHMANLAQTINVLQALILTEGEKMLLTPTYHVFDMYKEHQDATLLPVEFQCESYSIGEQAIPALSVSASRNPAGHILLTICNMNPNKSVALDCFFRGASISRVTGRVLTAETMTAHNTFDRPEAVHPVAFNDVKVHDETLIIQLPAKSVVTLACQ